jgi:hypothetical protein
MENGVGRAFRTAGPERSLQAVITS